MVRSVVVGLHEHRVARFNLWPVGLALSATATNGAFKDQHQRLASSLRVFHDVVKVLVEGGGVIHDHIGFIHGFNNGAKGSQSSSICFLDIGVGTIIIDFGTLGQRENTLIAKKNGGLNHEFFFHLGDFGTAEGIDGLVIQRDNFAVSGLVLVAADQFKRFFPIRVGIFEDAQVKLVLQHPTNMNIQRCFRIFPSLNFGNQHIRKIAPADLSLVCF